MQLEGLGECCKSPSGVWGKAPANKRRCILESKSAALVAAVFVDFPKNKCNFLHKNKLAIVQRVQFLTGRRPMRSFSPAAVTTIALGKSAPMCEIASIVSIVHLYSTVAPTVITDTEDDNMASSS